MKTSYYLIDVSKGEQGLNFIYDWSVNSKIYLHTNLMQRAIFYDNLQDAINARNELTKIVIKGHTIKILETNQL